MTASDNPICEEGHYPYPDECVRVVVGVIERAATAPSVLERVRTYMAVSSKEDLAKEGFVQQFHGFTPLITLSLDAVRFWVKKLLELHDKTLDERSTVGRVMGAMLLPFEHPYLVTYRGPMDHVHRIMVMARSAIVARKMVIPRPYAGMAIPLNLLEDLMDEMDRVKNGKLNVPYLWDYSDDGDYFQSLARWSKDQPSSYHDWKKKKLEELSPCMTVKPESM